MKVAVLNYSGSVGKTTIASHLLSPRMADAPIFAVESTNETAADLGLDIEQLRGGQFGSLYKRLLSLDNAIVDVGASNIEDFLDRVAKYEDSHDELDAYIVPVVSTGKAQRESIKTIQALAGVGVPSDRIHVVFNRVEIDVRDEFAAIFGYAKASKAFTLTPDAVVWENEVFEALAAKRLTIANLLADDTDYRALLRGNPDADVKQRNQWTDMLAARALAKPVSRNLDAVFDALMS